MRRSKNGSIPVAHEQIFAILETITASLCTETFFALFELLQEAKVAGHCCTHGLRKICDFVRKCRGIFDSSAGSQMLARLTVAAYRDSWGLDGDRNKSKSTRAFATRATVLC